MNRYLYLLSLLLCINLCICYEYTSENDSSNAPKRKKRDEARVRYRKNIEERRHRKRRDHDMEYDKDPVAQIDVASFIKSPEDEAADNDPYEYQYKKMNHGKDYGDYGGLVELNSDDKRDSKENDVYVDSDNTLNSQNAYPNSVSYDKTPNEKLTQGYDNDLKLNSDSASKNIRHNPQKKCALKNIKLPFFSHNKSENTKVRKEKKRKLYGFNKPTKEQAISKPIDENSPKLKLVRETESPYKYYKINKRSYIEMLCPACKRKFIANKVIEGLEDKRRDVLNRKYSAYNIRHNVERNNYLESAKEIGSYNTYDADSSINNGEEDFEDLRGRRKREDDNRNVERQKELEDLERRVDSVTISSNTYTKIDPKV